MPVVALQTVPIPGYAEAVRRESEIRNRAFLGGAQVVCGVRVYPLSLRRLIWLEAAGNAHVIPARFESLAEAAAHAAQVLYFCSGRFRLPDSPAVPFWRAWRDKISVRLFLTALRSIRTEVELISEVREWLDAQFMDAPCGSSDGVHSAGHAAYPAYIVDRFGEAGLLFTQDEILDMPLARLWQYWRLATRRLSGGALTNPSDDLATQYLAGVKL